MYEDRLTKKERCEPSPLQRKNADIHYYSFSSFFIILFFHIYDWILII